MNSTRNGTLGMSGLDRIDLTQGSSTAQACASPDDIGPIVGRNLRRLRIQRGHSLERLAKLFGVRRAMLGQIELGRSVPTVNLLWNGPFSRSSASRSKRIWALLKRPVQLTTALGGDQV